MRKINTKTPSESFSKMIQTAPTAKRSSIIMEGSIGEYFFINIEKIIPYEKQARKVFDEESLKNLASTISEYGIRQPLTVIKDEKPGFFKVISGERRWRAAKIAGLEKLPCIILSEEEKAEEIAIIENLQRVNLHPIELGEAYNSLIKNTQITLSGLASKIGIPKSTLSEQVAYSKIPDEIKNFLIEKNLKNRVLLRRLLRCSSIVEMKAALGIGGGESLTGRKNHIVDIYIQDHSLKVNIIKRNMSSEQKEELRKALKNIENILKL